MIFEYENVPNKFTFFSGKKSTNGIEIKKKDQKGCTRWNLHTPNNNLFHLLSFETNH